jgi:phosphatidate cytidylyltransferase
VGILYVGFFLAYVPLLFRWAQSGRLLVLTMLLLVWLGDTGAYTTGRLWGRHALCPRLSPHKTVEGVLGALAWGAAAGIASRWWLDLTLLQGVFLGLLGAGVGHVGDLFGSLVKRSFGVKDFGTLLPGHGGVLDRIDSVLLVAPCLYLYYTRVIG